MTVDRVPRLFALDTENITPEEREKVTAHMVDMYSYTLKLLLAAKETGYFIDGSINKQIRYCTEALTWLDSLNKETE